MASTQTGEGCMGWDTTHLLQKLKGLLEGFCRSSGTNKARVWHNQFSYPLIPNTAIKNFNHMSAVTTIDAGSCYVCVFDGENYQGSYQIICPGERLVINGCASLVVGDRKFSVTQVQQGEAFPGKYWEMDGPRYMAHFSSGYRYV